MSLVRNASAALAGLALWATLASAPAAQGRPQRTARARPSASPTAAPSAPAPAARAKPAPETVAAGDTLHYEVRAGQPFLVVLPARADGRPATYRIASAPAMSWLVDRSFFWQTLPTERGLMPVVFEPTPDGEPLVLMVEIVD
ncbi:MAG TPA: hypothetical protein VF594_12410 [Rubricoccaceae bacterium]